MDSRVPAELSSEGEKAETGMKSLQETISVLAREITALKEEGQEVTDKVAALIDSKREFVRRYERWPGSVFTSLEKSIKCTDQPSEDRDGNIMWVLTNVGHLPSALSAMLNSKLRGRVVLPTGTTFDKVAEVLRTNILPLTKLSSGEDTSSALMRWDSSRPSLDIFATAEQPYFSGVSLRIRIGATGSVVTYNELCTRILSISAADVCNTKPPRVVVKIFSETPHESPAPFERDVCENKERLWWKLTENIGEGKGKARAAKAGTSGSSDDWGHTAANLAKKLADHYKIYLLEMYTLTIGGKVLPSTLSLGVRDADNVMVGVPVADGLESVRAQVQAAIADVAARTFPSLHIRATVGLTPLDTSRTVDVAQTTVNDGQRAIVVLMNPLCIDSVVATSSWVLAVNVLGRRGAIFKTPKEELLYDFKKTELRVGGHTLRSSEFLLVANKLDIEVLDHVVATISTAGMDDNYSSAQALFRVGSFGFAAFCGGLAWELSPFAAWAWLRHAASPLSAWEVLLRHGLQVRVAAFDTAASEHIAGLLRDKVCGLPFAEADTQSPSTATICLGMVDSTLLSVPRTCRIILIDINPERLQATMRCAMDLDFVVVDIRLLSSWTELRNVERLSEIKGRESHRPPAASEEGVRTIKAFLLGNKRLPNAPDYVLSGSARRTQEEFIIKAIERLLDSDTVTARRVHVVLRNSGATTLLQRVAMTLQSSGRVQAYVVDDANATEIRPRVLEFSPEETGLVEQPNPRASRSNPC